MRCKTVRAVDLCKNAVALDFCSGLISHHDKVDGLWLGVAAACIYVLAYRLYGRWLVN
jgi:carbon starvation protein